MWIGRIDDAASVSGTCLSSTAVYAADQVADYARVALARKNSPQHIEVNGAHGLVSRSIGLITSRPANFMASASRTATFKLPA
jgi:hypothetical protein